MAGKRSKTWQRVIGNIAKSAIIILKTNQPTNSVMPAPRELGNCVGAAEDKLVYPLSVDAGNRRREGDNS